MKVISIGNKRETFWDSYLIDTDKTTAQLRVIQPTQKETCFIFDQLMELNTISYPCIVKDEKGYKMYYLPWRNVNYCSAYLSVIESEDGINWTRPELNLFQDSKNLPSNAVIDILCDGMYVFYDQNPDCPEDEKYKAVGLLGLAPNGNNVPEEGLWCYTSPDGYHFKLSHMITNCGRFDSLNTIHWIDGRYVCYLRNFHKDSTEEGRVGLLTASQSYDTPDLNEWIRDVRVMYSDDFKTWTTPKLIEFDDGKDYPLYTNNIIPYPRAPHIFVGFPTRYCERKKWTQNTEQMASNIIKKDAIENTEPRSGLAVTDCIFMTSHDGEMWHRYNEAFLTPGYEHEHNWVYGDCYPAFGFVDSGKETLYMYTNDWHRSNGYPKPLNRYEIRKDGFACCMADGEERVVITKPLIFEGKDLHLNFSTSAYGYIYIDILDEDGNKIGEKESFEIYGDTIDRTIYFDDGSDFSEFSGKPVRLRFRMRDSKLFSMKFE